MHSPDRRSARALQRQSLLKMGSLALPVCLWAGSAAHAQHGADTARPDRIQIEYIQPKTPAHQQIYETIKERQVLEKLKEIFSPFKLPSTIAMRTMSCDGVSNAWYSRQSGQPTMTICYEYLADILKNVPADGTAKISRSDAIIGQLFYVVAHEMGHAAFDLLDIPIFGRTEDAADQFSTYIMLKFAKEESRRLIIGAAYSYKDVVESKGVQAPMKAFSDVHGSPPQRFYNLICLAYGSDPQLFGDFVTEGFLPDRRAKSCAAEYGEVNFAFTRLIVPHLDMQLVKQELSKTWLPQSPARPAQSQDASGREQ